MPFKNGNPPIYSVWSSMISRCYRSKTKQYKDYGGRGIKVCPQWRHDYKQFIQDMLPSYKVGLTLDRADNNSDYSPQNCKWSTRKDQQRNQRRTHKVIIDNVEYLAIDLAQKYGIKCDTIVSRAAKGWSFERVTAKGVWSHCSKGHPFDEKNSYIAKSGHRFCRKCMTERTRLYRKARKITPTL